MVVRSASDIQELLRGFEDAYTQSVRMNQALHPSFLTYLIIQWVSHVPGVAGGLPGGRLVRNVAHAASAVVQEPYSQYVI